MIDLIITTKYCRGNSTTFPNRRNKLRKRALPSAVSISRFSPWGLRFSPRGLRFSPRVLRFSPWGLRFSQWGLRLASVVLVHKGLRFSQRGLRFRNTRKGWMFVSLSLVYCFFTIFVPIPSKQQTKRVMTLSVCKNVRILIFGATGSAPNVLKAPGSTVK